MIRVRRLTTVLLNSWLVAQPLGSAHARYRLRVWRESQAGLRAIRTELLAYLEEAFEDARRRIRRGFDDNLSPFLDPTADPAANYPAMLHRVTLQGYFGETLAVIAVEHWGAHGHDDWIVPAFLFRFHDQEFQHLESINERLADGNAYSPDDVSEQRPGRTGDDGLAFRINDQNVITDMLTLEAKCLVQNNNTKIEEAQGKLSSAGRRPPGVRELINLLEEYDTPDAELWVEALLGLWKDGYRAVRRYDGVAYACGSIPVREGRTTWMSADAPAATYTVTRRLEGMEFQFRDLTAVIDSLYRGA
jgi:hypothetical protein